MQTASLLSLKGPPLVTSLLFPSSFFLLQHRSTLRVLFPLAFQAFRSSSHNVSTSSIFSCHSWYFPHTLYHFCCAREPRPVRGRTTHSFFRPFLISHSFRSTSMHCQCISQSFTTSSPSFSSTSLSFSPSSYPYSGSLSLKCCWYVIRLSATSMLPW